MRYVTPERWPSPRYGPIFATHLSPPPHTVTTYKTRMTSVSHVRQWVARSRLFAILDATDTPAVPERAWDLGERNAVSLYRGRAEESLSSIAPYLMQLDEPTLGWIAADLWPEPWGVFVLADVPLDTLRSHFRRFLVVTGPQGESWYFRFYDPRVLEQYLSTCTPEELADFYGPVLAYGVTDLVTYGIKLFSRNDGVLVPAAMAPSAVVQG